MGKGFGNLREVQLGYILLIQLTPENKVYAANFSLGEDDEEFIGITNILDDAQVWKKKGKARQAVVEYIDLFIEQLENIEEIELSIRKLKRLSNGKLKDEFEEKFILESN